MLLLYIIPKSFHKVKDVHGTFIRTDELWNCHLREKRISKDGSFYLIYDFIGCYCVRFCFFFALLFS